MVYSDMHSNKEIVKCDYSVGQHKYFRTISNLRSGYYSVLYPKIVS